MTETLGERHQRAHGRIAKSDLNRLIELLCNQGYTVVGPKVEDHAIVYGEIKSVAELPQGIRDQQEPGKYRIENAGHKNYFEFNLGPHSWKQYLFPANLSLGSAKHTANGWTFTTHPEPQPKFALLGVRACELAAIAVQDRVFMKGPYVDPVYKARRESLVVIAVNCTVAAANCFCVSTQTGPRCSDLFDLALTELDAGFLVETGSEKGESLLESLHASIASDEDEREAVRLQQRAVEQITKKLNTEDIRNVLFDNLEHPRWDNIANRCLSCTNCTMVCPTCFCSSVSEVSDLTGEKVERVRHWDSCFNIDFSYMSGGVVRNSRRSRFRQWMTHKLASWHDQFESSGCVGCGRCITWCPVGIDLTEEMDAIRLAPASSRKLPIIEPPKTVCQVRKESPE